MMNHILTSWKSTVQSLLTVIIGLSGIAIPANVLTTKEVVIIALAGSVAKVILGALQQDAGVTLANVPGKSSPVVVESTEVPVDPTATPVAQSKP
jgi:hypothetical protein